MSSFYFSRGMASWKAESTSYLEGQVSGSSERCCRLPSRVWYCTGGRSNLLTRGGLGVVPLMIRLFLPASQNGEEIHAVFSPDKAMLSNVSRFKLAIGYSLVYVLD